MFTLKQIARKGLITAYAFKKMLPKMSYIVASILFRPLNGIPTVSSVTCAAVKVDVAMPQFHGNMVRACSWNRAILFTVEIYF